MTTRPLFLLACVALSPALALAAPLAVDPAQTRITVDVRATLHGFSGQLDHPAVDLDGDPASGVITAATVRFAWADLHTGDKARDRDLVAWAAAQNPDGVFTLRTLTPAGGTGTFNASGTLALNGTTRDLTFPVTITRTATGWAIAGETRIDHRDWALPKIRKYGLLTVDPVVTIRFAVAARVP